MVNSPAKPLPKTKLDRIGYYELFIFAFLLFEFCFLASSSVMDSNAKTTYLLTYEFGFAAKSLIGSIFSLFTDQITTRLIYLSSLIAFLILIVFISFLLGRIIRSSDYDLKPAAITFIFLFLSSPLSVTYLLGIHFGRFDTYLIIITLLVLVFLKKPILSWFIPLLFATAVLIHQGYLVSYLPALAIPVFYEIYKNKYSKRSVTVCILSFISAMTIIICLQLFPAHIPFDNPAEYADYLSKNADFKPAVFILFESFPPFGKVLTEYILPLTASYALPLGIALLAYSSPLLVIFCVIWKNCMRSTNDKILKFVFILCALCPLIFIPAAIFINDWDRYWAALINSQFILIFYFIYSGEANVIASVKRIGNFFNRHILLFMLIIIFACSLKFSEAATNMFSFIRDKEALIKILKDVLP